jgi:hypothetical protein
LPSLMLAISQSNLIREKADLVRLVSHEKRDVFERSIWGELVELLNNSNYNRVCTLNPCCPDELMSCYSGASLVISNRLHSCIVGSLCGARVVAIIDESRKLESIANRCCWGTISISRNSGGALEYSYKASAGLQVNASEEIELADRMFQLIGSG